MTGFLGTLWFSIKNIEAPFHVFVNHLYVFLGEVSVLFFGPFYDWVIYFSGVELEELLVYF